jgi:hypothetical protein
MVTDQQVRRLMRLRQTERSLAVASSKAGMNEKTARKYLRVGRLPSEMHKEHMWRTRGDPFAGVWEEVRAHLEVNAGLEAKTLFEDLQRRYPGRFADGQLRTLQRRVKVWRATSGPPKEVFFPQKHRPGELCQSDFTRMGRLGVAIQGRRFDHMIYHFVLSYSNWETGTICFSESLESLSEGLENALWELGGVPEAHRTDRLSSAVQKASSREEFSQGYRALLGHYGLEGRKIQAGKANENGDVEQRHHRFKKAVDQALMLRGSRDFGSREAYGEFVRRLLGQLNSGRRERFLEEIQVLRRLPARRLEGCERLSVRVGPSSTIRVKHNVYSVNSRLIGERVLVKLYASHLEVWYGQRRVETLPRLRGEARHAINYRHIIDWLVRKPGAFENYRYREDLFPSSRFRIAYDALREGHGPGGAGKEYLRILYMAATENERGVDEALRRLISDEQPITVKAVEAIVQSGRCPDPVRDVTVDPVELGDYDGLLDDKEVA